MMSPQVSHFSLRTPAVCATQALKGAMRDPTLAVDPTQTIEFQKLFTVASKHAEVNLAASRRALASCSK